jgi:hypothetical protein
VESKEFVTPRKPDKGIYMGYMAVLGFIFAKMFNEYFGG